MARWKLQTIINIIATTGMEVAIIELLPIYKITAAAIMGIAGLIGILFVLA